jgi:MFS family permease
MENYQVNLWLKIIAGIGSVLGALLLLRLLFTIPRKWILGFGIAGVAGVIGMAMAMPELFELTAAFFSAVIIASLGISVFTAQARWAQDNLAQDEKVSKIIAVSIFALLASVLVALLGGLMTAAPISSVNYMLEIDIFRGVKVAQLLPILYYILIFLALFGYSESKKKVGSLEFLDLKELLNLRVKAWMVLVGIIILGLGAYYILRTGHNSTLEVSSIEMVVRNKLEDFLVARPRTKEFLIAFPSIMMMVYCATRRWKLWTILFGLGGVIGITSVCNTFQHIRTPLYLGLYRTGYGLIFGILIGLAGILIFEGLHHLYVTWRKKQLVSNG